MDMALESERPRVVFIGGTGRSGTNVMRQLLARHAAVASLPFEYRFIVDPDGIIDFYCCYTAVWSPYIADKRITRLDQLLRRLSHDPLQDRALAWVLRRYPGDPRELSPAQYHGWELAEHLPGFTTHSERLIDRLHDFSYAAYWVGTESYMRKPRIRHAGSKQRDDLKGILSDFLCDVIRDYLVATDKEVFVEDNTWNILVARELLELVPDAKIVHVVRDPRDVVTSFVGQRWCPDDVYQASRYYCSLMDRWIEIKTDVPAAQYLEVKLETLVNEVRETVTALCEFIGLPQDEAMMQQDLSRSNAGRWQRDLTPAEQRILMNVVGDYVAMLGYPV